MKTTVDPTPRSLWRCPSGEKLDHDTYAKHRRTLTRMPRLFSLNAAVSSVRVTLDLIRVTLDFRQTPILLIHGKRGRFVFMLSVHAHSLERFVPRTKYPLNWYSHHGYTVCCPVQCPCQVPTFGTSNPNIGHPPRPLPAGRRSLRKHANAGFDSPSLENRGGLVTTATCVGYSDIGTMRQAIVGHASCSPLSLLSWRGIPTPTGASPGRWSRWSPRKTFSSSISASVQTGWRSMRPSRR